MKPHGGEGSNEAGDQKSSSNRTAGPGSASGGAGPPGAVPGGSRSDPDFWVLSDRVLFVSHGQSHEGPTALGVSGRSVSCVEPVSALRDGPLLDRARARNIAVYDVGASPIVPGFVNAHTHLALAPLRGITDALSRAGNVISDVYFRIESHLTAADVRAFSLMGAYESLLCGVTQVWDHYYYAEQVAEALFDLGLSGVVAPTLQDLEGPGATRWQAELSSTFTVSESERLRRAGIGAALGPHATDTVSDDLLRRVGKLAEQGDHWVHLHAAQTWSEFQRSRQRFARGIGQRLEESLSGAKVLLAHGLFLSDEECRRLAKARYVLAYCPYSQLQFGFLGPLSSWRAAGGTWALGTDCVASNDALDVQRELPLVAGDGALRAGYSVARNGLLAGNGDCAKELEELRVALVRKDSVEVGELLAGAMGCGLDSETTLGAGSPANFLVLDPDHPTLFPGGDLARTLAYGSTHSAIRWMCLQGRILGQRDGLARELLGSEPYRERLEEARRRRDELFERARLG